MWKKYLELEPNNINDKPSKYPLVKAEPSKLIDGPVLMLTLHRTVSAGNP